MISILLLAFLGVAFTRHISYYDDAAANGPIVTHIQERRICAELCSSGLGGEPCGLECSALIPQGIPVETRAQSGPSGGEADHRRLDACPVLCANRLGYPLCGCNYTEPSTPFFKVNYFNVCAQFCKSYNYRVYGCAECAVYANMTADKMKVLAGSGAVNGYDWNQWCVSMCKDGDGGSACYCDILPLALHIDE